MQMQLNPCSAAEIERIYHENLCLDFPKSEVKPLARILELYEKGRYFAYGLYNAENKLLAYAFFCAAQETEYVLLDYLAVVKDLRGTGIGSQMLALLKAEITKTYAGILLESENPDFALDKSDFDTRTRRIRFYLKCGFEQTKMLSRIFGVEYCIFVFAPKSPSTLHLAHAAVHLYRSLIPQKHIKENVSLRISEVF